MSDLLVPKDHGLPKTLPRRAFVGLAAAAVVAGCSSGDGLPEAGGQRYIEGDNTWSQIDEPDRGDPIAFTGEAVDGAAVDLADYRGRVVLLNTWFAGCAPCRKEAPDLEEVWQEYSARNVQFLGINTYDTANIAGAFQETFGITYPSVLDASSGQAMLALRGVAPQATPTTIILDTQGRVAARASGIVEPSTLTGLLDDAGADPAPTTATEPSEAPA